MSHQSTQELLLLHAVRLLGFADSATVGSRTGARHAEVLRELRAAEHAGWVQNIAFADLDGWSLTDSGKAENERQLASERMAADPEGVIADVYRDFLPLNARLLRAVTDWQITPTDMGRFTPNDHSDRASDERILDELTELGRELAPLNERLVTVLPRFDGYAARYEAALHKARIGQYDWVDKTEVDSCHLVWFQLHEDLIATLGIDRSDEI